MKLLLGHMAARKAERQAWKPHLPVGGASLEFGEGRRAEPGGKTVALDLELVSLFELATDWSRVEAQSTMGNAAIAMLDSCLVDRGAGSELNEIRAHVAGCTKMWGAIGLEIEEQDVEEALG